MFKSIYLTRSDTDKLNLRTETEEGKHQTILSATPQEMIGMAVMVLAVCDALIKQEKSNE